LKKNRPIYKRRFHEKSALSNQRPTIQRMTIRRYDKSALRQLGAKTNRRNDKSALMSNNQNIKYQQSAQNEETRFLTSLVIAESEVTNTATLISIGLIHRSYFT
jgi:hypothetical protein